MLNFAFGRLNGQKYSVSRVRAWPMSVYVAMQASSIFTAVLQVLAIVQSGAVHLVSIIHYISHFHWSTSPAQDLRCDTSDETRNVHVCQCPVVLKLDM